MFNRSLTMGVAAVALAVATSSLAQGLDTNSTGGLVMAVNPVEKTFVIKDKNEQSVTIRVATNAVFSEEVRGTISDLKVRQTILVGGRPTDDSKTFHAYIITVVPQGTSPSAPERKDKPSSGVWLPPPHVGVIASTAPTLTIQLPDKSSETVETEGDTMVMLTKNRSFQDVKPGLILWASLDTNKVAASIRLVQIPGR